MTFPNLSEPQEAFMWTGVREWSSKSAELNCCIKPFSASCTLSTKL